MIPPHPSRQSDLTGGIRNGNRNPARNPARWFGGESMGHGTREITNRITSGITTRGRRGTRTRWLLPTREYARGRAQRSPTHGWRNFIRSSLSFLDPMPEAGHRTTVTSICSSLRTARKPSVAPGPRKYASPSGVGVILLTSSCAPRVSSKKKKTSNEPSSIQPLRKGVSSMNRQPSCAGKSTEGRSGAVGARIRPFVVGSQCAQRSGAPRAHLVCCGGVARGWCLARRTTAGTATPLQAVPRPMSVRTRTSSRAAGFTRTGRNHRLLQGATARPLTRSWAWFKG